MAVATYRDCKHIQESETGSSALAYTTSNSISQTGARLKSFLIHVDTAGGGTLLITHKSRLGSAYNTRLATQAMAAITDYVYIPPEDGGHKLYPGDTIYIEWANGQSRTYGYTVNYEVE